MTSIMASGTLRSCARADISPSSMSVRSNWVAAQNWSSVRRNSRSIPIGSIECTIVYRPCRTTLAHRSLIIVSVSIHLHRSGGPVIVKILLSTISLILHVVLLQHRVLMTGPLLRVFGQLQYSRPRHV